MDNPGKLYKHKTLSGMTCSADILGDVEVGKLAGE